MISDIVFWYTGATVWFVIGILLFLFVIAGFYEAYRAARKFEAIWRFFGAPKEVQEDCLAALGRVGHLWDDAMQQAAWAAVSRRFSVDYELRAGIHRYDLHDRVRYGHRAGHIVSCGGGCAYEMRCDDGSLVINLRAIDLEVME